MALKLATTEREEMATDQEMREWARANGYSVGERGRLPSHVIAAYNNTCKECSNRKSDHKVWCSRYQHAEVTNMTVTEIPADYCQECWHDASDGHAITCSRYVAPAPAAPAPDVWAVPEVSPAPSETNGNGSADQEASITALIRSIAATAVTTAPQSLDVDQVRKIAEEVALEVVAEVATPRVYNIHVGDREVVTVDEHTHGKFESVVKIVGAGLHAYLVGPPGTGKTTLAAQVAKALGLPFAMISCDPTMPGSKLFGFVDANGNERTTPFWDVYENGGVFLYDEIDNGHPGIVAGMNAALSNGHCAFASRVVKRHPDFRCIAAANTFGTGATRAFVGRNQLDAATLDRFVTVEVGIDETLEEALTLASLADNVALAKEWLVKVRAWRKSVDALNVQVIISPRAAIEGATLLRVGFSMEEAADMKVWKGIDASTRAKIERGA